MTEKSVSEKPKKTKKSQEKSNKNLIDISTLKKNKENLQDRKYREYILNKIDEFNNNGKLTIAYFCDTFYPIIDGVIKVLDNYASLLKDKYNIVVIVPKHKNIVIKKDYLVIGVSSIYFNFVNYDLAFPEIDGFLDKAIKRLKIDLVHSHSPFNMGAYAAKVAKKKKVPLVMTMHSLYKMDFIKYTSSETITKYLLKQIMKVFNKATETWTMHENTKKELISYGYHGKVYFVPNATDYEKCNNIPELASVARKKYNISPSDKVLLFVGRLVEQKNIFFIANALAKVKEKNPNFKMFFVGNGPDERELKSLIKKNDLSSHTIFTGKISDRTELATIFALSDLFVFPSLYDTSSLVQIEAATFNTPTLFIENTVTATTITNNVNGFTAKNDVDAFADKIVSLMENEKLLKEIGENANRDLFITWKQVSEIVAERYEYLIKQNKNKQAKITAIKNAKIFK